MALPTQTPGGLYLPTSATELVQFGTVLAVGDKKNPGIMVGDEVLFAKFGGTPWQPDPINSPLEVLYLFHFDEIIALMEW